MSPFPFGSLATLLGAALLQAPTFEEHVFVVAADFPDQGSAAACGIDAPRPSASGLEPVGAEPLVRHFRGLHWIVNRDLGTLQIVDPHAFETLREIDVGAGSRPEDVLALSTTRAYVTRAEATHLLRVNPVTGRTSDVLDLSPLADADGIPELARMARFGQRLFIQLQRIDQKTFLPVAPSLLAVVDLRTETLVDADPVTPGVQAIALQGLIPSFDMQVEGPTRRLYVSVPSLLFGGGGIEEIDLDLLRSNGFITSEAILGGDLTGFVLVAPTRGYVLTHTDFALSSHLTAFSRIDGSHQGEKFVTFAQVDELAFDPATGQLFMPDPNANGLRVFDAATGDQLTTAAIDTGEAPVDLVIARRDRAERPVR
jgi:hypothetical protein